MQRCVHCGAPTGDATCWHCGQQAAIDGRQPPGEEPTTAPYGVPNTRPIEMSAAKARRRMSRRLLIGACAALFVTLSVVIAAGRLSRPAAETVSVGQSAPPASASQAAPVRSPSPNPPATMETAARPTWVGRRRAGWGYDGTKTISFALDSTTEVSVWASRARPQLVARCLARTTEVYLVTGPLSFEPQTGSHTVRVQVDDDAERSQQWLESEGSRELFAPDGAALSEQLAGAHRLRLGFTPFKSKPVTAEFIVDGFDELGALVARTCGRKPSPPQR